MGNGSFVAPREDGMFPEMGRIKAGTKQVPNVVREVEYEGGRGGFVNIAWCRPMVGPAEK